MIRFADALPSIIRRSKRAKRLLMLFDFDGTLSDIVPIPSKAMMIRGWRQRLIKLNKRRKITVGIVTGRAMADIRKCAKVPGILYAASHGYDIRTGNRRLLEVGIEHYEPIAKLARTLKKTLKDIHGCGVDDKQTAIAVHYRRVKPGQDAVVKKRVRRIAGPLLAQHGWQLTPGKMVIEIRPARQWNKGHACAWIRKHLAPGALACYIGDDVTDEDGFRAMGKTGISIRIGKSKRSCARYYVEHVDELIPWIEELI